MEDIIFNNIGALIVTFVAGFAIWWHDKQKKEKEKNNEIAASFFESFMSGLIQNIAMFGWHYKQNEYRIAELEFTLTKECWRDEEQDFLFNYDVVNSDIIKILQAKANAYVPDNEQWKKIFNKYEIRLQLLDEGTGHVKALLVPTTVYHFSTKDAQPFPNRQAQEFFKEL